MDKIIYKLADGRCWLVPEGRFLAENETSEDFPGYEISCLRSAEGKSDAEYLLKTIKFYNYSLGEFADPVDRKTLESRMAELEAEMNALKAEMETVR